MKVVIFAGGLGTRLSEETTLRPKPMVEIGGKPILWHIMKIYESYGFNEFVICLGYKGYMIKEYFMNYYIHHSNITFDLNSNNFEVHNNFAEDIKVSLIDTGLSTLTAGRLKRVKEFIGDDTFMLTYGDGVSDIDLSKLLEFHNNHGKAATMTSIQPPGRFGSLDIQDNSVNSFIEKPKGDGAWINGGFFILEPTVFDFIPDNADQVMWEDSPLEDLASAGQLMAYKHPGFWKCMDHLRDKVALDEMWKSDNAKWKVWK